MLAAQDRLPTAANNEFMAVTAEAHPSSPLIRRNRSRRLSRIWKYLHRYPEPSMREFKTSDFLETIMKEAGLQPQRFKEFPGFFVDIGTGQPTIGLRADMDALIQDVDGVPTAVHSCGHDANMAIVATVMLELAEMDNSSCPAVRAIFQPSEEAGNGAELVAGLGVADNLDYLFGVHLRPGEELPSPGLAPAIAHGACLFVRGSIHGEDHHGARPHQGVNAIDVACEISQALYRMKIDPQTPSSAKMTVLRAGGAMNVIPGSAQFGIDLRAQTNEAMEALKQELVSLCGHITSMRMVTIDLDFEDSVPAAVIGPVAERVLTASIQSQCGGEALMPRIVTSGSDDFHFYSVRNRRLQAAMLGVGADVFPGLHHPDMKFEFAAMGRAVGVLVDACMHVPESSATLHDTVAGTESGT
ncbi:amidohydrolase [Paenarthrobacter sp. NPDC089316]|uniref:amidohydrolase n=1 Tax=unclassified Paenarthrobacter TaxID=2634190 RepID=UPI00343667AB